MAEEITTTVGEATPDVTVTPPADDTSKMDELAAELAKAKAERDKYKNSLDKTLREKGEITKQLRQKQTTEEREAEEKAEREREMQEELENTRKELNHMKAVSAYKTLSDESTVEKLIDAISDGDHASIAVIIEQEKTKAVKEAQAEWMKSRPQPSSGDYSPMSKEDILAIEDDDERQKAIARNLSLFK